MHRTNSRSVLLPILLLASCGGDTNPASPAANGLDTATVNRLAASLDRLAAMLERVSPATTVPPAMITEGTVRSPANDETAELAVRVAAIEHAIASLPARANQPSLVPANSAVAPIQNASVMPLIRMLQSEDPASQQEGRRTLFGLTQQQVLQRLGMPTETDLRFTSVTWTYVIENAQLQIVFRDGFVQAIN